MTRRPTKDHTRSIAIPRMISGIPGTTLHLRRPRPFRYVVPVMALICIMGFLLYVLGSPAIPGIPIAVPEIGLTSHAIGSFMMYVVFVGVFPIVACWLAFRPVKRWHEQRVYQVAADRIKDARYPRRIEGFSLDHPAEPEQVVLLSQVMLTPHEGEDEWLHLP